MNYLKTFKNVSITALSCASVVLVAKNMEQGKATVEIVRPIDISARESLNFGRVILMDLDQGGRVTVNADGTFEHDRTGLVFDLSKGNPRAGTFNLTGDGDTGFNVHLPRTVIQLRQVVVSGTAATLNATITSSGSVTPPFRLLRAPPLLRAEQPPRQGRQPGRPHSN